MTFNTSKDTQQKQHNNKFFNSGKRFQSLMFGNRIYQSVSNNADIRQSKLSASIPKLAFEVKANEINDGVCTSEPVCVLELLVLR